MSCTASTSGIFSFFLELIGKSVKDLRNPFWGVMSKTVELTGSELFGLGD